MRRDKRLTGYHRGQADKPHAPKGFELNNPWHVGLQLVCWQDTQRLTIGTARARLHWMLNSAGNSTSSTSVMAYALHNAISGRSSRYNSRPSLDFRHQAFDAVLLAPSQPDAKYIIQSSQPVFFALERLLRLDSAVNAHCQGVLKDHGANEFGVLWGIYDHLAANYRLREPALWVRTCVVVDELEVLRQPLHLAEAVQILPSAVLIPAILVNPKTLVWIRVSFDIFPHQPHVSWRDLGTRGFARILVNTQRTCWAIGTESNVDNVVVRTNCDDANGVTPAPASDESAGLRKANTNHALKGLSSASLTRAPLR